MMGDPNQLLTYSISFVQGKRVKPAYTSPFVELVWDLWVTLTEYTSVKESLESDMTG